jgi:type VI protein secretion system component Hcp
MVLMAAPSMTAQPRPERPEVWRAYAGKLEAGAFVRVRLKDGASGKANFADFYVTKMIDAFSVPLLHVAELGDSIADVKIEIFEVGGTTAFAIYTLHLITSDSIGGSTSGILENVTFTYDRISHRHFSGRHDIPLVLRSHDGEELL